MKPLPPDTTVSNYEYPAYEPDRKKETALFAELPPAEGFTPFEAGAKTSSPAEALPVVQKAMFQDFAKVVHPQD
jgi:hypothetical protein